MLKRTRHHLDLCRRRKPWERMPCLRSVEMKLRRLFMLMFNQEGSQIFLFQDNPHQGLVYFYSCLAGNRALKLLCWFYIQFYFVQNLGLQDTLEEHQPKRQEPTDNLRDILWGSGKSLGTHVLQVRDGDVKQVLKLLRHAQIFNNKFRLFAEVAIDFQGSLCIDM